LTTDVHNVHLDMTKTMTVTQLRKEIFDVVEAAKINKQVTNIMLHGEVVAEIRPKRAKKFDWDKYIREQKAIDKDIRNMDWSCLKKFRKEFDNKIKGW